MSLKPFSASVVPEQTASVARRAFPKGSLCCSLTLTTGQKFDNLPPDTNIEALEVGH